MTRHGVEVHSQKMPDFYNVGGKESESQPYKRWISQRLSGLLLAGVV